MTKTGELRLGLLGAGRIGRVHGDAVARVPGARLVAVADAMPEAADAIAARHGAERRAIEAIIGADDVDAVLVCTPTDMHADLIEAGVRAGKAVFCEKPIALDLERTRACLGVVREAGGTLMLGFNRRADHHFRALKAAVEGGATGRPELIEITSRDPEAPPLDYIRRSGGLFKDMTIHDLDVARWLMGEEFVAVTARGAALTSDHVAEADDVDTATLILETADGRQAVITNSRRATYGYDQRVEVHGAAGCAQLANPAPHLVTAANGGGFVASPLHDFFMTRYADAYATEIAAFCDFVAKGEAPTPSGEDGLAALVLAEAAGRSMREGRTVRIEELTGGMA